MGYDRKTPQRGKITQPITRPTPTGPVKRPGTTFVPSTSDEIGHGGDHIPSIENSVMMAAATATKGGSEARGTTRGTGGTRGTRDTFGPSTSDEIGHGGDHIPGFLGGIITDFA